MKKLLYLTCLIPSFLWANQKVSSLNETVTPRTTDYLYIVKGSSSMKVQAGNILTIPSTGPITAPYFVATSGTSTSTFAGHFGIGTLIPQARLSVVSQTNSIEEFYVTKFFDGPVSAALVGRHARGTEALPSAVLLDDRLASFGGRGYGTTGFSSSSIAIIFMTASENWTDSAQGTYISFVNTATGTTVRREYMRLDSGGNLGIGTDASGNFIPAGINNILNINKTYLNLNGSTSQNAINIALDSTVGGAGVSQPRGILLAVRNSATTSGTGLLSGIFNTITANGSQNYLTNNFTGSSISLLTLSGQTGTIADTNGIRVNTPSFSGTKPTTSYGIHVFNQGVSGSTTSIGLQIDAQSGANSSYAAIFAGGAVGISTSAPITAFSVVGGVTVTSSMTVSGISVFGSPVRLKGYTVATLPVGVQGDTAFVTDALGPTFLVTVIGGGLVVTPVFYDGVSWKSY